LGGALSGHLLIASEMKSETVRFFFFFFTLKNVENGIQNAEEFSTDPRVYIVPPLKSDSEALALKVKVFRNECFEKLY